jgi:RimJ/RimL family protein N-acetyltransferase
MPDLRAPDRLVTERLVLRRFTADDHASFAAMNADPEVMRWIADGATLTREQSDALLERADAGWLERGFGLWAVEVPEEGLAGFAGLAEPAFLPDVLPGIEIGWRLRRGAWGRGYATEASRAVLGVAFERLGLAQVLAVVHPRNVASRRVAEKLGMRRARDRLRGALGIRLAIYEATAPQPGSGARTAA